MQILLFASLFMYCFALNCFGMECVGEIDKTPKPKVTDLHAAVAEKNAVAVRALILDGHSPVEGENIVTFALRLAEEAFEKDNIEDGRIFTNIALCVVPKAVDELFNIRKKHKKDAE